MTQLLLLQLLRITALPPTGPTSGNLIVRGRRVTNSSVLRIRICYAMRRRMQGKPNQHFNKQQNHNAVLRCAIRRRGSCATCGLSRRGECARTLLLWSLQAHSLPCADSSPHTCACEIKGAMPTFARNESTSKYQACLPKKPVRRARRCHLRLMPPTPTITKIFRS